MSSSDRADEPSDSALVAPDGLTADDAWEHARAFASRADQLAGGLDADAALVSVLLARVARITAYDYEAAVHRPAGLTYTSFYLVATLAVAGPMENSRLAKATGMSRAAVSSATKTLERDGWVQRERSDEDGRSVILSLSDRGASRIPALFRDLNDRERQWNSSLSAEDRHELVRLLRMLLDGAPEDARRRS